MPAAILCSGGGALFCFETLEFFCPFLEFLLVLLIEDSLRMEVVWYLRSCCELSLGYIVVIAKSKRLLSVDGVGGG